MNGALEEYMRDMLGSDALVWVWCQLLVSLVIKINLPWWMSLQGTVFMRIEFLFEDLS